MWLIETQTGWLRWVEDPRRVHYAALSHVWAKPGDPEYVPEQTFQDLLGFQKEAPSNGTLPISQFSDKLRRFCETASKDGFELGWADTCCIDKTSSSDLSEAINSMFMWYGYSRACYAFLHDVRAPRSTASSDGWNTRKFEDSKWFTRGWTLQELIASPIVIFVRKNSDESQHGRGWEVLGTKHNLASLISSVTKIDVAVLTFETPLEDIPVARRMAWMQGRQTTRLEDEAYCLMGIFGVNMQTNYGEGRYAFIRLQEAILMQSSDQTIFAWGTFYDQPLTLFPSISTSTTPSVKSPKPSHSAIIPPSFLPQYMLASSPKDFGLGTSANTVLLSRETFQERLGIHIAEDVYQVFEATPYGLRIHAPVLNVYPLNKHPTSASHCAILACEDPDRGVLVLLLRSYNHQSNEFFAGAFMNGAHQLVLSTDEPFLDASAGGNYYRLAYISWSQLDSLQNRMPTPPTATLYWQSRPITKSPRMSIIHIPHRPPRSAIEPDSVRSRHEALCKMAQSFEVEFSRWSQEVLQMEGYRVIVVSGRQRSNQPLAESTIARTPSSRGNTITISKNEPGSRRWVYLEIQVGRCSCRMGQLNGVLAVVVTSLSAASLDAPSLSPSQAPTLSHRIDHPVHVYSWSLERGSASRQIEFDYPSGNGVRLCRLRLTLTTVASPQENPQLRCHRYCLSAEIRELEAWEVPQPRQPLPLNPIPTGRTRSNSSSDLFVSGSPERERGHASEPPEPAPSVDSTGEHRNPPDATDHVVPEELAVVPEELAVVPEELAVVPEELAVVRGGFVRRILELVRLLPYFTRR